MFHSSFIVQNVLKDESSTRGGRCCSTGQKRGEAGSAPLALPCEAPGAAGRGAGRQQQHQQWRPQVAQRPAADVAHDQAREAGRLRRGAAFESALGPQGADRAARHAPAGPRPEREACRARGG